MLPSSYILPIYTSFTTHSLHSQLASTQINQPSINFIVFFVGRQKTSIISHPSRFGIVMESFDAAANSYRLSKIATNDGHGENSPYFDGWKSYDNDPFHPTRNPHGVIQMGLAENQVRMYTVVAGINGSF